MKFKIIAVLSIILSLQAGQKTSAQMDDGSFTVFCTGNHDSTGSCLEVSETEETKQLECIMVPGNIIDCKNETNEQIDCILIAATSAQAEFSCRKNRSNSINEETADSIDNASIEVDIDQNNLIENEGDPNIEVKTDVFSNPFR